MDPASRLQTGELVLWQLVKSSYVPHSAPDSLPVHLHQAISPLFPAREAAGTGWKK